MKVNKTPVQRAARLFGVPVMTLRDRVSGLVDPESFGRETLLSREEELSIVEHAENCARLGYGYTNTGINFVVSIVLFYLSFM